MHLRRALATDVPHIVRLVAACLAEFGMAFGEGSPTDEQLRALPGSYDEPGGRFFVAVEDDHLLGTAGIFPVGEGVYELRKMYLDPGARRRGLGRQLLAACIDSAQALGGQHLVLDTTEQMTAAIAFYEQHGFVRDDAQRRATRCSRGYRLDLRR